LPSTANDHPSGTPSSGASAVVPQWEQARVKVRTS
jgi:hypothetical protein